MRLQLPNRIPVPATVAFASVLFCVQLIEHTHLAFSLMFFGFVVLSATAFNTAGGFSRIAGAYVFWFSLLTMTFGITWKAVLGQPGDSNTQVPLLGVTIYTCSMFMLLLVVIGVRKLDMRPFSIAGKLRAGDLNYTRVALGCIISGVGLQLLNAFRGDSSGGILSALNQLNIFFPLGIIFGTIGAIKNSGGRRAIDVVNGFGIFFSFATGAVAFSKQGMLTPPVCWAVGACYMRFKLRPIHMVVLGTFAAFAVIMAGPMSGLRDNVPVGATNYDRAVIFINGILHFGDVKRAQAERDAISLEQAGGEPYYGTLQGGLIDRLTMVPVDDLMFTYTAKGHYVGYTTVFRDFENWIPHFIMRDKVGGYTGNYYAHEIGGLLAADDMTTGISFSPLAESYHVGGWAALFLLTPTIWLLLFTSIEFVSGDLRYSPWGLLLVVYFAHAAPESLLVGLIYYIGYGNLAMVVAMIFCTRLAPIIGALFHGRAREVATTPVRALGRAV